MVPSLGSVGDPFDNAMAGTFFATSECERLALRRYGTKAAGKEDVFQFIGGMM